MVLSGERHQLLRGHLLALRPSHMENIMRKIAALFTGTVAAVVLMVAPATSASAASHGGATTACLSCWSSR